MSTTASTARLPRETRGLSDGHVDGVEATRLHEDAVDANLKFRKSETDAESASRPPAMFQVTNNWDCHQGP